MAPLAEQVFDKDYSKYGFHDKEEFVFKTEKGLSKEVVEQISKIKNEPEWMLKFRLKSLEEFYRRPMPQWGANLNIINFDDIYYYLRPTDKQSDSWDDVPEYIKNTFNKLGIPEAEQKFLGGVGAQYESEMVYHKIRKDLEEKGVIFLGMDDGLKQYPEIVKKYFGTVIPYNDNKIA
ncbi:MAG: Fe-S cluster assembly protein SufB, partial [Nanoarchaeota archaeon]|nr:Fe-S cluster assembly protein SufB [Nanoarchaeota archaeon]